MEGVLRELREKKEDVSMFEHVYAVLQTDRDLSLVPYHGPSASRHDRDRLCTVYNTSPRETVRSRQRFSHYLHLICNSCREVIAAGREVAGEGVQREMTLRLAIRLGFLFLKDSPIRKKDITYKVRALEDEISHPDNQDQRIYLPMFKWNPRYRKQYPIWGRKTQTLRRVFNSEKGFYSGCDVFVGDFLRETGGQRSDSVTSRCLRMSCGANTNASALEYDLDNGGIQFSRTHNKYSIDMVNPRHSDNQYDHYFYDIFDARVQAIVCDRPSLGLECESELKLLLGRIQYSDQRIVFPDCKEARELLKCVQYIRVEERNVYRVQQPTETRWTVELRVESHRSFFREAESVQCNADVLSPAAPDLHVIVADEAAAALLDSPDQRRDLGDRLYAYQQLFTDIAQRNFDSSHIHSHHQKFVK